MMQYADPLPVHLVEEAWNATFYSQCPKARVIEVPSVYYGAIHKCTCDLRVDAEIGDVVLFIGGAAQPDRGSTAAR